MDPHDFLDVANELVGGASEAEWRSAVSRAYYATFHLARKLFLKCGFTVPDADRAHGYLWLRLQNCGHSDLRTGGVRLKNLRAARNWADYDLYNPMSHQKAMDRLQLADELAQLFDEAMEMDDILDRITETIKQYEKNTLKENTWKS